MSHNPKPSTGSATEGILLRHDGGVWLTPETVGYSKEAELQKILFDHPELLPGVGSTSIACREFESGVGPADVLVITDTGRLFAVECKLAYNPQIRREIIGQLLDYASRLWGMPLEEFEARWQARTGTAPFQTFDDAPAVSSRVEDALTRGAFTLVLAVDRINPDLKRIVEYLNSITRAEIAVIAFEASRVADGDVEILLPRVYGAELAEAKQRKPGSQSANSWTVQEFLAAVADEGSEHLKAAEEFLETATRLGFSLMNGTAASPSLILGLADFSGQPISVYSHPLRIRLRVHEVRDARGDEAAAVFARPLIPIKAAGLDGANLNLRRKINLPAESLIDPETREMIAASMRTLVEDDEQS